MQYFPAPVETLIDHFAKLPGIGRKSAQRLAFFVLSLPDDETKSFAEALLFAKSATRFCEKCQNLSIEPLCPVCTDQGRDRRTVCVVSGPKDVAAIERTSEYRGQYHVLHGVISPMNRTGPDDLRIAELIRRVSEGDILEIIMATNPDTEGEATALYIARILKPFQVRVTRLAYGIPIGGHLEFTDEITLSRAIEGRRDI